MMSWSFTSTSCRRFSCVLSKLLGGNVWPRTPAEFYLHGGGGELEGAAELPQHLLHNFIKCCALFLGFMSLKQACKQKVLNAEEANWRMKSKTS